MWTYEQMKPYKGTQVTVKNVDDYLHMFDIIKDSEDCYLVPECSVTYRKDTEEHGFEIIDFSDLEVHKKDILVLYVVKHVNRFKSVLEVYNTTNGTSGYIEGYYNSDDSRYYLCNSVAKHFKDKKVTVKNYLIYDKEEVANYVDAMFNL